MLYTYGGSTSDIHTKDVQVGSGVTSITFTGLEAEPTYWSCAFKSNFGISSGYQRTIAVAHGYDTFGNVNGYNMSADVGCSTTAWTASYNNGSLTITSQGTNQGGYFHQPGYYQLTYAYDDGSGGASSITTEPLSVTTNGTYTAPNGKAYTPVYVNVSGASIGTKTLTNSTATATSLQFTSMLGQPKAFFLRLTAQIARSSSYRYYYVENVRYNGTNTNGRYFYQYNGTLYNDTTHYSYSYSGTTLTISSTGSQSGAGGSFYNGTYELVYIY